MKKVNILSVALVSLLFLSSFGLVEYSVIHPRFNLSITNSTKSNLNRNEWVGKTKKLNDGQPNDQKPKDEESKGETLVSWTEYFALSMKAIFMKAFSLFISLFIS
jgi:hypothetical protein